MVPEAGPFYGIVLRSATARAGGAASTLAIFLLLGLMVIRQTIAARYAAEPTIERLQRAISLEPDRAEYHNQLGEIYLYSFSNYDPRLALESFQQAVRFNPHVGGYWLNLARAFEGQARRKDALQAVETARRHDPRNPSLAWEAANMYALEGSIRPALRAWKEALEGDASYISPAIELAWKLDPDTRTQLEKLIPPNNEMDFRFLYFLLRNRAGEPDLVWDRIMNRGQPFEVVQAKAYLDTLLLSPKDAAGRRADVNRAIREWRRMLRVAAPDYEGDGAGEAGKLVTNGEFEHEILDLGFGWRWAGPAGASMVMDSTVSHSGQRSLRMDFDGTQNLLSMPLYQIVPVEPNRRYLLTAWLQAHQVTSSSGPRLYVLSDSLEVWGREVFETNGWIQERVEFTSPAASYLVKVGIGRQRSTRFSPELRGSVWIDDVSLVEIGR